MSVEEGGENYLVEVVRCSLTLSDKGYCERFRRRDRPKRKRDVGCRSAIDRGNVEFEWNQRNEWTFAEHRTRFVGNVLLFRWETKSDDDEDQREKLAFVWLECFVRSEYLLFVGDVRNVLETTIACIEMSSNSIDAPIATSETKSMDSVPQSTTDRPARPCPTNWHNESGQICRSLTFSPLVNDPHNHNRNERKSLDESFIPLFDSIGERIEVVSRLFVTSTQLNDRETQMWSSRSSREPQQLLVVFHCEVTKPSLLSKAVKMPEEEDEESSLTDVRRDERIELEHWSSLCRSQIPFSQKKKNSTFAVNLSWRSSPSKIDQRKTSIDARLLLESRVQRRSQSWRRKEHRLLLLRRVDWISIVSLMSLERRRHLILSFNQRSTSSNHRSIILNNNDDVVCLA